MSERRSRARSWQGVAVATVALLAVTPLVWTTPAAADDATFDAFADAYGFDFTIANDSVPLGIIPQGAGPVGHARLASLGDSDAYASFPYPGDTMTGLPGTAGAITGFPTPQYPMFVATQAGDDPKSQEVPGVSLQAESGASLARGRGVVGVDGYGSAATATVERLADDSVRSEANTDAGATILNVMQISGARSHARVIVNALTGELERTSSLSITRITVPGLVIPIPATTPGSAPIPVPIPGVPQLPPLTFPPMPIPQGGTTLNAPDLGFVNGTFTVTMPAEGPNGASTTYAVPSGPVLDALKAQGIRVTFQGAQNFETGVVAPTMTFGYTAEAPPANSYYNGPTQFSMVVGRSVASVDLFRGPDDSAATTDPVGGAAVPADGYTVDSAGATPGALGENVPLAAGVAPPTVDFTAGGVNAEQTSLASRSFQYDLGGFYLLLVGIAAVAFLLATGIRTMGVRLWRS